MKKIKPCPFCGMQSEVDWHDTLYPTGIARVLEDEVIHYIHQSRLDTRVHKDPSYCYQLVCSTNYGGCGAEMHADSIDEVINKWNTRSENVA